MDSYTQVFFDFPTTFRTFLRSSPCVNFSEELPPLPTHILNDGSKLPKRSIKQVFSKHPLSTNTVVEVFHKDQITRITKRMGLFKVKVFSPVVNFVVKPSHFKTLFFVILRPFLFPRKSTLQRFQLALQSLKKLGRFYENTITGCQKLFQPNIYPNRMTVRSRVGNSDITLPGDRCLPIVGFPQYPHLLDHKSCWDRAMQVNWNGSNLRQFNAQVRYRIFLELRKQQRIELPILLEAWKTKSSFLKVFPTSVQLLDSLLENLRRDFTQFGKFLFGSWQVVELLNFARKLQTSREDVFLFQGASIYQTLTTIAPIFDFPKRVVIRSSTDFHPLNELLFLSGAWIDSVAVSDCQHPSIILDLLDNRSALNVKLTGHRVPST